MEWSTFNSPFSHRYGSTDMRGVWSETNKRYWWRRVWWAVAVAQSFYGVHSVQDIEAVKREIGNIDVEASIKAEAKTHHDLVAELEVFIRQTDNHKLHLGCTSSDITDTATVIQVWESANLIKSELSELLVALGKLAFDNAYTVCMGYTHLQPAEPTTLGYRLANNLQDLEMAYDQLKQAIDMLRIKGPRGPVGTAASHLRAIGADDPFEFEKYEAAFTRQLAKYTRDIASQTSSKLQLVMVGSAVVNVAVALHKLAVDVRLMYSQNYLTKQQDTETVGSSAMPHKVNPIEWEKVCGLTRLACSLQTNLQDNAMLSMLERTLDDSSNEREALPAMFLAVDEAVITACRSILSTQVNGDVMTDDIDRHSDEIRKDILLIDAVRNGADRGKIHGILRNNHLKRLLHVTASIDGQYLKQYIGERKSPVVVAYTGIAGYKAAHYCHRVVERFEGVFLESEKQ